MDTQYRDDLSYEVLEDDTRAVYDGSISDSILRGLSSYYNCHARPNTPYTITRLSQYVYQLVYGTTSDCIHFTDATIVTYTVGTYNNNTTIRVSDGATITVDTTGSTAYVYSSSPVFLPSSYIVDSPRLLTSSVFWLLVVVVLSTTVRFIWSLLRR